MVASIQHRMSSTFSLLANWTWSKCLNIEDAQGDLAGTTVENPNNPALDYGPCGSDLPAHREYVLVAKSDFSNRFNRARKTHRQRLGVGAAHPHPNRSRLHRYFGRRTTP